MINVDLGSQLLNQKAHSLSKDPTGFLWIQTASSFWRYDGFKLKPIQSMISEADFRLIKVPTTLFIEDSSIKWVGSKEHGLFMFDKNSTQFNVENSLLRSNHITTVIKNRGKGLWIGTDKGLHKLSISKKISYLPFLNQKNISKDIHIKFLLDYSSNQLFVATEKQLYEFNKKENKFKVVKSLDSNESYYIFSLYKDDEESIWVSTEKGLLVKRKHEKLFKKFRPKELNFSIVAVAIDDSFIWIGSFSNGIFKVSKKNNTIQHINYENSSLLGNDIVSLHLDSDGLLWVTTFGGDINLLDASKKELGHGDDSDNSLSCLETPVINGFIEFEERIWLVSNKGLVDWDLSEKICKNYNLNFNNKNTFLNSYLHSVTKSTDNYMWLATSQGLSKLKLKTMKIDTSYAEIKARGLLFIVDYNKNILLMGGWNGLFEYNKTTKEQVRISLPFQTNKRVVFHSFAYNFKRQLFFATSEGIMWLNGGKLSLNDQINTKIENSKVLSILFDKKDNIWIGTNQNGIYVIDTFGEMILHINESYQLNSKIQIKSMVLDNSNNLWAGTSSGLLYFDTKKQLIHFHYKSDGLQSNDFIINSAYKAPDGKLYFGGSKGFNAFYPEDIKLNMTPPNIVLTDFTRFGKSVEIGIEKDGFLLESDINQLDELVLSHKDYVVGFEFAALDYADPSRNKYAYKLEGQDPEWIYTDADNRNISYSNLSAGEYTFRVKGSNKDGTWNEEGKSLKVIVKPAPWFSWWAYVIYLITLYCLVSWYFKKKNAENQRLTDLLKSEVERQTQELQTQKQTVEELLARKNELFANISHEFRTPLTLILGPINKLLNSHLPSADINALKMVNRNANRLLTMIEQLLQMAKVSTISISS